mgnify:CR=1 FL=1
MAGALATLVPARLQGRVLCHDRQAEALSRDLRYRLSQERAGWLSARSTGPHDHGHATRYFQGSGRECDPAKAVVLLTDPGIHFYPQANSPAPETVQVGLLLACGRSAFLTLVWPGEWQYQRHLLRGLTGQCPHQTRSADRESAKQLSENVHYVALPGGVFPGAGSTGRRAEVDTEFSAGQVKQQAPH